MRLENGLEVPAGIDEAWRYMLDVERIAPCVPGAELLEIVDERTWKGRVKVKLGPLSLSFAGQVVLEEMDETARHAVLKAEGRETKGRGAASAVVSSSMEPMADGGTRVVIVTDLTISGAMAQYGRGMIADVSKRMTDQFAACVRAQLAGSGVGPAAQGKPIAGIRLALWTAARAIGRFFARLWRRVGRRRPPE